MYHNFWSSLNSTENWFSATFCALSSHLQQLHLCLGFASHCANLLVNYLGRKWQLFGRQRAKIGFARADLNGNYKLEAHTLLTRIMICVFTRSALCAEPLLCAGTKSLWGCLAKYTHRTYVYTRLAFSTSGWREPPSDNKKWAPRSREEEKISQFRPTQSGGFWMTSYLKINKRRCHFEAGFVFQVLRVMRPVCKFKPRRHWIKKGSFWKSLSADKEAFVWPEPVEQHHLFGVRRAGSSSGLGQMKIYCGSGGKSERVSLFRAY